jgi:hypothetical protein
MKYVDLMESKVYIFLIKYNYEKIGNLNGGCDSYLFCFQSNSRTLF